MAAVVALDRARRVAPPAPRPPAPDPAAATALAVLVVRCSPTLEQLTDGVRRAGLQPVLVIDPEHALVSVSDATTVVVLEAGVPRWETVLTVFEAAAVPVVLVGGWRDLRQLEGRRRAFGVLAPVEPAALARALALAVRDDAEQPPSRVSVGPIEIDLATCSVTVEGREVALPPKQFAILRELATNAGRPVAARELIARVWPESPHVTSADLHWNVWRLRKLIGDSDRPTPLVRNRRGFGYLLEA